MGKGFIVSRKTLSPGVCAAREKLGVSKLAVSLLSAQLAFSLFLSTERVSAEVEAPVQNVPVSVSVPASTKISNGSLTEGKKGGDLQIEDLKVDESKINASKMNASNIDVLSIDASKTDASKTDASKTDASKTDASKTDASKADESKTDVSNSDDASTAKKMAMITGAVSSSQTKEAPAKPIADVGPIIIDNDEIMEVEQTIEYKELETVDGGTKVKTGATFPVVISSQITSKSASKGDAFEARLKYDLKIGDRLVAEKGSPVIGHINYVLRARSAMHSLVSPERWYRNSGCLGISFDEIVNGKGEHIPLVATPAQQARIIKNKAEGRELGVNHNGQVTGPWAQQLRYKAVRIGLNAAMAPAGVFSFGAMPVALGVIGAANPSFAFMKPIGQNVRHRRIKGFVWGALSGVPGSWIVEDTVIKGQEAVIKPGDEFLAEFKQEFTGEPETEVSLIPGASTKVKGQVMPVKKGKK